MAEDNKKIEELIAEKAKAQDFAGLFELMRINLEAVTKKLDGNGIKDTLKSATRDRVYLSFIDGVEFGSVDSTRAFTRLQKLLGFTLGSYVLSKAWGVGQVKRIDDFYKRITVDFTAKRGHQFTYLAACDMIEAAPENHILLLKLRDPAAFEELRTKKCGEFVKRVVESWGGVSLVKLEDICVKENFVKRQNWKSFWNAARADLAKDKCVKVPAKRTDPIEIKAQAEDYSDNWLTAFTHETDPQLILAGVKEYLGARRGEMTEDVKRQFAARLRFAITAARNVNDALYARLAHQIMTLGFTDPAADEMRDYLRDRRRFVSAAATLPSSEVGNMISFLATDPSSRAQIYAAIPDLCYSAVQEVVKQFADDPALRSAVGACLRQPKSPATLVALVAGRYRDFKDWTELPSLQIVLTHAIKLGEGRQGGETLRMQNIVRRLFMDSKWLGEIFTMLNAHDQELVFERFQASLTWESASQHTIVTRMLKLAPQLEAHLVKAEKKKEYARVTSFRSFGLMKKAYLKLINEEMPENIRKIEFAKGFGDLSENAEYQYAKDEQRALMQKQTLMQADLEAVKPSNFADATTDEVMPGVMVTVATDEGEKTYALLGEWDNDVEMGILSQKAKLAVNMLGKKAGDKFELPGEGEVKFGIIRSIAPLTDAVKDWMKLPEGVQI